MGDRAMAEIKTEEGSLFFYTHSHGDKLPCHARLALENAQSRQGDDVYALRRVVDTLICLSGARDNETGAGLMLSPCCEDEYHDDSPSVVVDLMEWSVTALGLHARGGMGDRIK